MSNELDATTLLPEQDETEQVRGQEDKFSAAKFIKSLGEMLITFRDRDGNGWAIAPGSHGRAFRITSTVAMWFHKMFHEQGYEPPSSQLVSKRVNTLEAVARFGSDVREVCNRVGEFAGVLYVDLGDAIVRIRDAGWDFVAEAPVIFQTSAAVLAHPVRGGTIDLLRRFVNTVSDSQFLLVLTYIAYLLTPRTAYPILLLVGEQGSGKSTVADIIQSLTDGFGNRRGSLPEGERDLAIAASESRVLCLDNVSKINGKEADRLSRIATGATFKARKLYSNGESVVFRLSNPVMITSISLVSDRADFLSRCLIIELPYLSDEDRGCTEREFLAAVEEARPSIFGAFLDLVAKAVALEPDVHLPRYHRMSDFVRFGEAVARALDMPEGSFLRAFELNEDRAAHAALDNPLATAIQRLLAGSGAFRGTPTELLHELRACWPLGQGAPPGSPKSLSAQLSRIAQPLRHIGVSVDSGKSGERWIHLETTAHASATDDPAASAWAMSRTMLDLLDSDSGSEDSHELIYS